MAIHDGHGLHENTILGKSSFWPVQAIVVTAATFGREIGLTVAYQEQPQHGWFTLDLAFPDGAPVEVDGVHINVYEWRNGKVNGLAAGKVGN